MTADTEYVQASPELKTTWIWLEKWWQVWSQAFLSQRLPIWWQRLCLTIHFWENSETQKIWTIQWYHLCLKASINMHIGPWADLGL